MFHRPRCMIHLHNHCFSVRLNRPVGMFVAPMALNIHGGISISVNNDVDSVLLQTFGQLRDEQLSSAVIFRWNGDERGGDQSNPHIRTVGSHSWLAQSGTFCRFEFLNAYKVEPALVLWRTEIVGVPS